MREILTFIFWKGPAWTLKAGAYVIGSQGLEKTADIWIAVSLIQSQVLIASAQISDSENIWMEGIKTLN